jgi:hypothetical protein
MLRSRALRSFGLALPLVAMAPRSDPVAVYAVVDRVVFEPSKDAPERVQVWGALALFDGKRGEAYRAPTWGGLYFELCKGKEKDCLAQWTDLERAAKSREVIGIGARYEAPEMRVIRLGDPLGKPVPYPVGWGLQKVRHANYAPVTTLHSVVVPVSPVGEVTREQAKGREGDTLALVARPLGEVKEGTSYVFMLERDDGEVLASPLVPAAAETRWEVPLRLVDGQRMTWRVHAVREGLARAPVSVARFAIKAEH